jgi:hypothetical protein
MRDLQERFQFANLRTTLQGAAWHQQGSQIWGTPSLGCTLGVRRCSPRRRLSSTSALPASESSVGLASVLGFSRGRHSIVGRDHPDRPKEKANGDGYRKRRRSAKRAWRPGRGAQRVTVFTDKSWVGALADWDALYAGNSLGRAHAVFERSSRSHGGKSS